MSLVQLRRRTFLLGSAALACGSTPDEPTTTGDTGDTTADATTTDATTTDATTGAIDPTTGDAPSSSSTSTATGETGDVCTPAGIDTGLTVADVPIGACILATNPSNTLVLRDDLGFYAMTNRCTHFGCAVACPVDGVMNCPCHGSQFNANGDVLVGPATIDLYHFLVTFECVGDAVKIYVDKSVSPDDRQTRVLPP